MTDNTYDLGTSSVVGEISIQMTFNYLIKDLRMMLMALGATTRFKRENQIYS